MTCRDRDSDLLLFGLGELPLWQRWRTALHLRTCARCRARQAELAQVSDQIAGALRPPSGGGGAGGPGTRIPVRPAVSALAPLMLLLVLSMFTLTLVAVWYAHSHWAIHQAAQDDGCRPDLPNDKCK